MRLPRQVNIWMSEELYEAIRHAAFHEHLSMSAWVREHLDTELLGDSDQARVRRGIQRMDRAASGS